MMQQLATPRADIAASPTSRSSNEETQESARNGLDFDAMLRMQQADTDRMRQKAESNVSDEKTLPSAQPKADKALGEVVAEKQEAGTETNPQLTQENEMHDEVIEEDVNNEVLSATEETTDSEIDWLALVDAVRELEHKQTELDNAEHNTLETEQEAELNTEESELVADSISGEGAEVDNINAGDAAELLSADTEYSDEVLLSLRQTLQAQGLWQGDTQTPLTDDEKALLTEVMTKLDAISDKLSAMADLDVEADELSVEEAGSLTSSDDEELLALAASMLEAMKLLSAPQDARTVEGSNNSAAQDVFDNVSKSDEQHLADAETLLALIDAELKGEGQVKRFAANDTIQPMPRPAPTTIGGESATKATTAEQNENADVNSIDLLKLMANDSATAEVMTKSVTEIATSVVPMTDAQQSAVKQSLQAGLSEIKEQLAKGHEPAINLEDLVAKAYVDAGVNVTSEQSLQLDQQLAQLTQSLSMARTVAQHVTNTDGNFAQVLAAEQRHTDNAQVAQDVTKARQQFDSQDKPVNIMQPEGQQQLNEKIRWMMNSRNTMAEIRLDPPEMGSMQIRVNVSGDAASVNFVVQSQQARDAIADAVPRLRDMLAEQGIELGESFVSQQGEQGNNANGDGEFAQGRGRGGQSNDDFDEAGTVIEQPITRRHLGAIDDYA